MTATAKPIPANKHTKKRNLGAQPRPDKPAKAVPVVTTASRDEIVDRIVERVAERMTRDPIPAVPLSQVVVDNSVFSSGRPRPRVRPELLPFSRALYRAMQAKGMSAADLARAVWGTMKDAKGYTVAKNRDRIGAYLAAISYPEPGNLKRIAEALGVSQDVFAVTAPQVFLRQPRPEVDFQIATPAGHPGVCVIKLSRTVTLALGLRIAQLIAEDVLPDDVNPDEAQAVTVDFDSNRQTPPR